VTQLQIQWSVAAIQQRNRPLVAPKATRAEIERQRPAFEHQNRIERDRARTERERGGAKKCGSSTAQIAPFGWRTASMDATRGPRNKSPRYRGQLEGSVCVGAHSQNTS